jgi:hypothetical protein
MAKKKMTSAQASDRLQYTGLYLEEAIAGNGIAVPFPSTVNAAEKVGIEIHEVQFFLGAPGFVLDAPQSIVVMALGQIESRIPAVVGDGPQVFPNGTVALARWEATEDIATALVNGLLVQDIFRDLSSNPILVHPAALFGMIISDNAGAVARGWVRIGFKYVELTDADYNDILQTVLYQNVI